MSSPSFSLAGVALELDVADVESIRRGVGSAVERLGQLDILVNNAGLGANHAALDVTEADLGPDDGRQFARLVLLLSKRRSPHAGARLRPHRQRQLAGKPRRYPRSCGLLRVEYTEGTRERLDQPDYLRGVLERIPLGKVGTIEDVAAAVIYLASPAGRMVTGTVLPVDGGWTAQ